MTAASTPSPEPRDVPRPPRPPGCQWCGNTACLAGIRLCDERRAHLDPITGRLDSPAVPGPLSDDEPDEFQRGYDSGYIDGENTMRDHARAEVAAELSALHTVAVAAVQLIAAKAAKDKAALIAAGEALEAAVNDWERADG